MQANNQGSGNGTGDAFNRFSQWVQNSIILKGLVIFIVVLLLLIPTSSVRDLIRERESTQQEAIVEVSQKWGGAQTIIGPILTIPTHKVNIDYQGNETMLSRNLHILPELLDVKAQVSNEKRHRGIFSVSVYDVKSDLKGHFNISDVSDRLLPGESLMLGKATLNFGISDLRALEKVDFNWDGKEYRFEPGTSNTDVVSSGLHASVPLDSGSQQLSFQIPLQLKGSSYLSFAPVGRNTKVNMTSDWPDPSFFGSFLPDEHNITESGFSASWTVIDLNRNYGQYWIGQKKIDGINLGVEFMQPVDHYSKSYRSVKYALLIISLTFVVFFFLELLYKVRIHPIQYVLVGFALIIFFLLLISLSEHIPFNWAYLVGSLSVTGLIAFYLKPILKSWQRVALSSGLVASGYAFIFVTLQDQDYSLVIGSLGLFVILAIVMIASRNINWYKSSNALEVDS